MKKRGWQRTVNAALVLALVIALFPVLLPTSAHAAGWYDANWQYRRAITIDHTKVTNVADPSTTYANFPVLVYATGLSNIKAGGADIRFTLSDGTTEIPREIESYSGGTLWAWVKVTLTKDSSDSTDDVIYMYYGNASATEPAEGSAYGAQNVWGSNYQAVWHLKETTGGTDAIKDSTSNVRHGTDVGSPTLGATGQMGNAIDFGNPNTTRRVDTKNFMSSGITALTAQAWVYKTATKDARIVYKNNAG